MAFQGSGTESGHANPSVIDENDGAQARDTTPLCSRSSITHSYASTSFSSRPAPNLTPRDDLAPPTDPDRLLGSSQGILRPSSGPSSNDLGVLNIQAGHSTLTDQDVPNRREFHLKNSGSVARDHLASERTFLAYVRTSIAFASVGILIVHLLSGSVPGYSISKRFAIPVGSTAVFIGLSLLVVGVTRFFTVQAALKQGHFPPTRIPMTIVAFALATIITTIFAVLLIDRINAGRHRIYHSS